MRLRCTTEAWLDRLVIRENSAASVTHGFGTHDHASCDDRDAQRPGLRCRPHQPASHATVPGAPLTWTFGNSCEDAHTRRARCTMKPWLNVSEAAAYTGVSRDTIYTACEHHELRRRAREWTLRHQNPASLDRQLAGAALHRLPMSPTIRKDAERSAVMIPESTSPRGTGSTRRPAR